MNCPKNVSRLYSTLCLALVLVGSETEAANNEQATSLGEGLLVCIEVFDACKFRTGVKYINQF